MLCWQGGCISYKLPHLFSFILSRNLYLNACGIVLVADTDAGFNPTPSKVRNDLLSTCKSASSKFIFHILDLWGITKIVDDNFLTAP